MRFLLIAYDFPPVPSPQSLRWAYLARELALAGHEAHVLAPDIEGYGAGGLPTLPDGVIVHRVWPGPLAGYLTRLQRRRRGRSAASGPSVRARAIPGVEEQLNWKGRLRRKIEAPLGGGLNWKGRLMEAIKAAMSLVLFPDSRAEWVPWARRTLDRVLAEYQPDVVISSHEPATTLGLGLRAKRKGWKWVADLGDPVLAPYTPRRWRKRALALERALCERADLVTVTSENARDVLKERHGIDYSRCAVLTQGFDQRATSGTHGDGVLFEADRLEMLYTGSFYSFRRIGALLDATLAVPSARLNVATIVAPPELLAAMQRCPDQIRLLGFVPHDRVIALQRRCDVLVNLANANPVQVPGKFYEYLGAGTAILHIGGAPNDAAARLLLEAGGGWCEADDYIALRGRISALAEEKQRTGRVLGTSIGNYDSMQHSWGRLAARLVDLITAIPGGPHSISATGLPDPECALHLRTRQ